MKLRTIAYSVAVCCFGAYPQNELSYIVPVSPICNECPESFAGYFLNIATTMNNSAPISVRVGEMVLSDFAPYQLKSGESITIKDGRWEHFFGYTFKSNNVANTDIIFIYQLFFPWNVAGLVNFDVHFYLPAFPFYLISSSLISKSNFQQPEMESFP